MPGLSRLLKQIVVAVVIASTADDRNRR